MNTQFLLMAQYDGLVIIPLTRVCEDYFCHLTQQQLLRKVVAGEIDLPITRIEKSQKSAKGVHIQDMAKYIDDQRAKALKENEQLQGRLRKGC